MPRVDFYLLRPSCQQSRELFVCRLVEKAWQQGHKIYLHAHTQTQAMALDKLLWSFRDNSFIPHDLYPHPPESLAPVRIGWQPETFWTPAEILMNLSDTVPAFFSQVARVIEVLNEDAQVKALGRERYRTYKAAGSTLPAPVEILR